MAASISRWSVRNRAKANSLPFWPPEAIGRPIGKRGKEELGRLERKPQPYLHGAQGGLAKQSGSVPLASRGTLELAAFDSSKGGRAKPD